MHTLRATSPDSPEPASIVRKKVSRLLSSPETSKHQSGTVFRQRKIMWHGESAGVSPEPVRVVRNQSGASFPALVRNQSGKQSTHV